MPPLSQLLPRRLKDAVKVLLDQAVAIDRSVAGQGFCCPVCLSRGIPMFPMPFYFFSEWDRNKTLRSPFRAETLNMEHYSCGFCGASDRDRLYALYFGRVLSGQSHDLAVLEIAPAHSLTRFLKETCHLRVRTADLNMKGVDDKVDLTNMHQYADARFDVFICSHVLEHVDDDVAGMRELHRVLKPGGWGIAMVPIDLDLKEVYEDPSVSDEASRWRHFGQNDHVRMYSKSGFVERLQSVGFTVDQLDAAFFGADVFARHAIHPRSVLYVARK
jgi:SAM-dependent methyltransferase